MDRFLNDIQRVRVLRVSVLCTQAYTGATQEVNDVLGPLGPPPTSREHVRTPSLMRGLSSPGPSREAVMRARTIYVNALPSHSEAEGELNAAMAGPLNRDNSIAVSSSKHPTETPVRARSIDRRRDSSPASSSGTSASVIPPTSPGAAERYLPSGLYTSLFGSAAAASRPSPAAKDLLSAIANKDGATSPTPSNPNSAASSPARSRHHRANAVTAIIDTSTGSRTLLTPNPSTPGLTSATSSVSSSPASRSPSPVPLPSLPRSPIISVSPGSLRIVSSVADLDLGVGEGKGKSPSPSPNRQRLGWRSLSTSLVTTTLAPTFVTSVSSDDVLPRPPHVRRQSSLTGDWPQSPREPRVNARPLQDHTHAVRAGGASARSRESLTARERLLSMVGATKP